MGRIISVNSVAIGFLILGSVEVVAMAVMDDPNRGDLSQLVGTQLVLVALWALAAASRTAGSGLPWDLVVAAGTLLVGVGIFLNLPDDLGPGWVVVIGLQLMAFGIVVIVWALAFYRRNQSRCPHCADGVQIGSATYEVIDPTSGQIVSSVTVPHIVSNNLACPFLCARSGIPVNPNCADCRANHP